VTNVVVLAYEPTAYVTWQGRAYQSITVVAIQMTRFYLPARKFQGLKLKE